MTFDRPDLLVLAPATGLLVVLGVSWQWRRRRRLIEGFGGEEAASRLAPEGIGQYPLSRLAVALLACVAITVAAAGPQTPEPPPIPDEPLDLVVVVDISLSMSAEDVGSSRASRAVEVLRRLTEALPNDRVGVVVFADWPYTLVPLTHDLDVVRFFGATLGPPLLSDRDQGTGLAAAVTHARAALDRRRRPEADAAILVVSDGEEFSEPSAVLQAVRAATADAVSLWTVGIGTDEGARIVRPEAPGTFVLDERGIPVVTRMDATLLREMADAGAGSFFDASDERGLEELIGAIGRGASLTAAEGRPPGAGVLLSLLALPLLLLEGTADRTRARGSRRS